MFIRSFGCLLSSLLLFSPGCGQASGNHSQTNSPGQATRVGPSPAAPAPTTAKLDACGLLTSAEIQAVQGEAVTETKRSEQPSGSLQISQCFYATPTFSKSVSLAVGVGGPGGGDSLRRFWREKFHGASERGEGNREERREEESTPPLPISGVGDEAFWVGGMKAGVLYVLKGDKFVRVSIGGPDRQQVMIEKMKTLTQHAIKRL